MCRVGILTPKKEKYDYKMETRWFEKEAQKIMRTNSDMTPFQSSICLYISQVTSMSCSVLSI